ncbi:right-handed parallel beta-helix repeat-containing protein [Hugenholtzia roseola]|uniref:right-handed parallel beta-helix repeat-containing protein n=1 Tax=Hugenholtzia roseola TaxID=1002 RepID=UPI0004076885|nr:right-handed parallel beta-helix repeat-containing protein [Hugenholtzia roseola]
MYKKTLLLALFALLLLPQDSLWAQVPVGKALAMSNNTPKTVRVRNVAEFVAALQSNTTIEMEYGLYNLSNYNSEAYYDSDYPYSGFHINGLSNLTIRGVGDFPTEIILDADAYATVLAFNNCKNVRLENVEVGHGASTGYCQGAVLRTYKTDGFFVSRSVLYGSGTYGLEGTNSQNITIENSTIRSTTYGALYLIECGYVNLNKVTFTDNGNLDIFSIHDCSNVIFNSCIIKDNTNSNPDTEYHQHSSNKLFQVDGNSVTLNNCLIKFNRVDYLANSRSAIRNNGSQIESNNTYKGMYEK